MAFAGCNLGSVAPALPSSTHRTCWNGVEVGWVPVLQDFQWSGKCCWFQWLSAELYWAEVVLLQPCKWCTGAFPWLRHQTFSIPDGCLCCGQCCVCLRVRRSPARRPPVPAPASVAYTDALGGGVLCLGGDIVTIAITPLKRMFWGVLLR